MIAAHLFLNHRQNIWGFEIQGHSGYAEEGADIICSAVSALAINTANSLEKLLGLKPAVSSRDGYLSCEVPEIRQAAESQEGAELLFRSLEQGLQAIADAYGKKYLNVTTYQKA